MKKHLCLAALSCMIANSAFATEGMFTPDQLPDIAKDLRKAGLKLDPDQMTDLTAFPMGAVISLGGCTASFVSPKGLAVTNHHCARGSVQFNSTEENNYLKKGFLAQNLKAELPAAPGSRIYVTVKVEDVTKQIVDGLDAELSGRDRYQLIEVKEKDLVKACEMDPGHRCKVAPYFGGLQYKLIKRLEIRDVRLVYAPADAIGKYGGDVDNWQWPRHTGDFAFYRAYVAPNGSAADFAQENVPYAPGHSLKVSAGGLDDGDFVMVAGYPGSTSRYARLDEVENTFSWQYPTYVSWLEDWIETLEAAAPEGSEVRIKYESRLSSLNNFLKNTYGQIEGARRVGLITRKKKRDAQLDSWLAKDESRKEFREAIAKLDALSKTAALEGRRKFWYNNATRPQLLGAAQRLYRLSQERLKPDSEREPGYQERDMTFFEQGLDVIDRRFDPAVDEAEWALFLTEYLDTPLESRVPAFDVAMALGESFHVSVMKSKLDHYYQDTKLADKDVRRKLMSATPSELEASSDPFMKLAVALYETEMAFENEAKDRAGSSAALRPKYMSAIIGWQKSQGQTAYPDANSTLRITYGHVMGGSPKDGMIYEPFTRLEGIIEKDTGEAPFNAPHKQLEKIKEGKYGRYKLKSIGSVPVNFLSDLDTTGGNSGSATLNSRGELVGLLFDGTFESVNSDWDFDPRTTRSIHVDTRYMLWVMENIDDAKYLIKEMDIKY